MDNSKVVQEKPTLIHAYERLQQKCTQLRQLADLTERLNQKLNRTEEDPKDDEKGKEEGLAKLNIVELFNLIADKMGVQINEIGRNTELSIQMID